MAEITEPQKGVKIFKLKSGKFRVKYYATNGEMLAHSELLNSKQAANKNVKAMERIFVSDRVEITVPKDGITISSHILKQERKQDPRIK